MDTYWISVKLLEIFGRANNRQQINKLLQKCNPFLKVSGIEDIRDITDKIIKIMNKIWRDLRKNKNLSKGFNKSAIMTKVDNVLNFNNILSSKN